MAKKALVVKNEKRFRLAHSRSSSRNALFKSRNDKSLTMEKRILLQSKINSLPRNSSFSRYKKRCSLTGRPRGFCGKFGISRLQFRLLASWSRLPGVVKSSW